MTMSNKPKQLVDHYGVFKDTDTGYNWLLQQGVSVSAIGLPEKHCPFKIKSQLMMAPHRFTFGPALDDDPILNEYESRLRTSEVLQLFDPVYLLTDSTATYVQIDNVKHYNSIIRLQNILNTNISSACPASLAREQSYIISKRLASSNLMTYVVYALTAKDLKMIDDLAREALVTQGRLVLAGIAMPLYNTKDLIKIVKADQAAFDFIDKVSEKKLREIGAYRLKKLMRSECHFH